MGSPGSKWCPQCGAEYLPQMKRCADCGVALVDESPPEPDHELPHVAPDAPPFEVPDEPDWFVLPDGRRVKELPLGPDVPTNTPNEWAYNSWTWRWLIALFRDLVRRAAGRP